MTGRIWEHWSSDQKERYTYTMTETLSSGSTVNHENDEQGTSGSVGNTDAGNA
jgi:hypothetical protein